MKITSSKIVNSDKISEFSTKTISNHIHKRFWIMLTYATS